MKRKSLLIREGIMWIVALAVMAGLIVFCVLMNRFYLMDYLQKQRIASMKTAYKELNAAFDNESYNTEDFKVTIENLCEKNNVNILVIDSGADVVFSSSRNADIMGQALMGYLFKFPATNIVDTIETKDKYEINMVDDQRTSEQYYDMWGLCDNGNVFLIRSSRASVLAQAMFVGQLLNYLMVVLIAAILVVVTIISRYMYVRELKVENEKLSQDIAQKEKIDNMRKEFLSNVSHELKTPLAIIQGYAEGLKDSVNSDEESRDFYCDVIMDEASKMNKMVNKLLDLNHIEFGDVEIKYDTFNIVELIKNYLGTVGILIEQKNADVRMSDYEPIYVYSDEYFTQEIFNNYFSNALNHLEGDNIIEISLEIKDNLVYVYVFNTGKQIPEDSIPYIWDKFYKVDKARTREYGGSGVGLSIVKALLENMDQKYGVDNFAEGVRFFFTLKKAD